MQTAKVFHYAPWSRLPAIVADGFLRPSNAGAPGKELPLLWFSLHRTWEPTATKMVLLGGVAHRLIFREQRDRYGCCRFALPATDKRLLPWREACKFAGISSPQRKALERAGRAVGGDPSQWFAVAESLALMELQCEVLLEDWEPADAAEMARVWRESRGPKV